MKKKPQFICVNGFFFRNVKFDRFIPSLYQNLRYKNKMCYFLVFSYKSMNINKTCFFF